MTVAIYARKSTDQSGVSDEQRSVARQVEHARAYAARKGWQVLDEHVYVDDGISGAEFERRPGLQRLRATLRPRPPFAVLIVSEQSRLSRDTADTLQFLKELARAGVRVFTYQDDRPISIETPSDTLVTTINAWKDSEARRESSVRTHEALARKAKAAHVTGGRVFGYRNVDVFSGVDAHGRPLRSHVTREIRKDEAAVARRIFELCAGGLGVKRIASSLNVAGLPRPRAQQGRATAGARRACGASSSATSIGALSGGTEPRSGTPSARCRCATVTGSSGCGWTCRNGASCRRHFGRQPTHGSRRPARTTSLARRVPAGGVQ
jgi:site-specific DNA recombinase